MKVEQSFPFNAFHELHNTFKQMQMRYPTMNKRTLNSGSQFLPALADTLDPTHRSQKKDRLSLPWMNPGFFRNGTQRLFSP